MTRERDAFLGLQVGDPVLARWSLRLSSSGTDELPALEQLAHMLGAPSAVDDQRLLRRLVFVLNDEVRRLNRVCSRSVPRGAGATRCRASKRPVVRVSCVRVVEV